ncbi:hypothetical protein HNI00_00020 [Thermoleptolyngbya oregonensis NK1-22]|uniref:Uncharacterized protein n=1 Tax=Thermoleptolyngbya oregonensis NK1-22 TaxID=2547457 RepID=A0AA96Y1I1_9CYAN|nr:hypothetical protein [Thermoleptolyngbya oregonensis]WOB41745.1 hypothetical protein HNI00_00020 [Thermoleptolyngbya oregonensis NK1-22]
MGKAWGEGEGLGLSVGPGSWVWLVQPNVPGRSPQPILAAKFASLSLQ